MVDNEVALYIGPGCELALQPDWGDDLPEGWSRLYCYEEVAAGILRLIRERDEARHLAETYAPLRVWLPWVKP
jgi:hypothetical protein